MDLFRFDEPDATGTTWGNSQEPTPGDTNVRFTTIPRRLTGILLDWVLPIIASIVVGNALFGDLLLLAMLANSIVWQGMTGYSLGKRAVGLRLAYVPEKKDTTTWTFVVPGVTRCAIRYVLHLLDFICFIGFFKAVFFNKWGKSFADEICKTVVIADKRFDLVTLAEAAALRLQILFRLQGHRASPRCPCGVYSGVSLLCISSTASRSIRS